jgi:hypothetical protein
MARESDLYGIIGEKLTIAPGATNALFMPGYPGELASIVKYVSGGSLEVVGAPPGASLPNFAGASYVGSTWLGLSLVPFIGNGYLLGSTEILNITGPARYYLMATGSTVIAMHFVGRSQGF